MITLMQQAMTVDGLTVVYDLGAMRRPQVSFGLNSKEFATYIDYLVTIRALRVIVETCWTVTDPLAEFETFLSVEIERLICTGFLTNTDKGWRVGLHG